MIDLTMGVTIVGLHRIRSRLLVEGTMEGFGFTLQMHLFGIRTMFACGLFDCRQFGGDNCDV